jgi:2-(1,2-epoxy-1,2-dihydrophenyl)acetyl-CoA isomerase
VTYQNLTLERKDGVAVLTLTRADAMNALNMDTKHELAQVIQEVANDPAVRCLLITGSGKAFSAGGDIVEMSLNINPTVSRERLKKLLAEIFIPLHELEKPTIAAINGHAHGAGLSLALACDIVIASESATMSCAFSKLGLLPDCGSMYFLPRRVPMHIAKELIFTGKRISGEEAYRIGLVNQVVPADELDSVASELARQLGSAATVALGLSKRILNQSLELTLRQVAELEAQGQAILMSTEDHLNARAAFMAKNTPTFNGR